MSKREAKDRENKFFDDGEGTDPLRSFGAGKPIDRCVQTNAKNNAKENVIKIVPIPGSLPEINTRDTFFKRFLSLDGVNHSLVSREWFYNHYQLILWELSSFQLPLKNCLTDVRVSPDCLLKQLQDRYNKEIVKKYRSALHRIIDEDDTSGECLVLVVVSIDTNSGDVTKVIVSDGWLCVPAIIDQCIKNQFLIGKFKVGTQLVTCNAKWFEYDEPAVSPCFYFPANAGLLIHGNSTKLAQKSSKMGFQDNSKPLQFALGSLNAKGGVASMVSVVINRIYPIKYMPIVQHPGQGQRTEIFSNQRAYEEQFNENSRNVRTVARLLLHGLHESDVKTKRTAMLVISDPSANLMSQLKEGIAFRIYNLHVQQSMSDIHSTINNCPLALNTISDTRFETDLRNQDDIVEKVFTHRKHLTITEVCHMLSTATKSCEIDCVGVVVTIGKLNYLMTYCWQIVILSNANCENNDLITIKLWGGLKNNNLTNIIQTGNCVKFTDVQFYFRVDNIPECQYSQYSNVTYVNKYNDFPTVKDAFEEIIKTRLPRFEGVTIATSNNNMPSNTTQRHNSLSVPGHLDSFHMSSQGLSSNDSQNSSETNKENIQWTSVGNEGSLVTPLKTDIPVITKK